MRRTFVLSIALACTSILAAPFTAAQAPPPHGRDAMQVYPLAEVKWADGPASLPPGAKFAVLEGDPAKEGLFTMRLLLPDGFQIQPHFHVGVEHVTVLAGTLNIGMGDTFDRASTKPMPTGTFGYWPAGMRHFAFAEGQTVLQLQGLGPWTITYVNPADDRGERSRNLTPRQPESAGDLIWYHTIELPGGVVTPGIYDHRPYVAAYGLPADLRGRTVLDVGAASGFFTFELERRGAKVTSTDLPDWKAHDFGAQYEPELAPAQAEAYLHEPFLFAHRALGSRAERKLTSIYDISPASTGTFDLVFCGSVLIHLSDPATALRRLQSVTREAAIIATVVHPLNTPDPLALFTGHLRGDTWWAPNRAAFEALVRGAGFAGWEWYSEFALDYADGTPGPYHAVIRAWNTAERPSLLSTGPSPRPPQPAPQSWEDRLAISEREIQRLHGVVNTYQDMKFIRLVQWLHPYRERIRGWFR